MSSNPNDLSISTTSTTIGGVSGYVTQLEYTSQTVFNAYQQNLATIFGALTTIDSGTQQVIPLNSPAGAPLLAAVQTSVNNLKTLLTSGIVDPSTGIHYFLTVPMAQNLDIFFKSLSLVGVNVNAPTVTLTGTQGLEWQDLVNASQILQALFTFASTSENHTLQSLIELSYVKTGNDLLAQQLGSLQNALSTTQKVLDTLTTLQNVHNQIQFNSKGNFTAVTGFDMTGTGKTISEFESGYGRAASAFFGQPVTPTPINVPDPSFQLANIPANTFMVPPPLQPYVHSAALSYQTIQALNYQLFNSVVGSPSQLGNSTYWDVISFGGGKVTAVEGGLTMSFDAHGSSLPVGSIIIPIQPGSSGPNYGYDPSFISNWGLQPITLTVTPDSGTAGPYTGTFLVKTPVPVFTEAFKSTLENCTTLAFDNGFLPGMRASDTYLLPFPMTNFTSNETQISSGNPPFYAVNNNARSQAAYTAMFDVLRGLGASETPIVLTASPPDGSWLKYIPAVGQYGTPGYVPGSFNISSITASQTRSALSQLVTLRKMISGQIPILSAITPKLAGGGEDPTTLLAQLRIVLKDINDNFKTSGGQVVTSATAIADAVAGYNKWILDNYSARGANASNTNAQLAGQIQQNITFALTSGQSLNNTQNNSVQQFLYTFEQYYKSASSILQTITQIIQRIAQGIAR